MITKTCIDNEILKDCAKNLNEQRKNGKYCDYTLKTEDGGSFTTHKCILESVCPFFEKMFNSEFNDKDSDSVVLKRCSSSTVLEKIIEFIYTGEVEITSDIAKETLDAALFLGLNTLVDTCTDILVETVNTENCFELLSYSESYFSGEELRRKCIEEICENIGGLMNSQEFVKLSLDLMRILCACDRNVCNDEQLYLAIVKWIEFDLENRETSISTLLDKINFENMSYEFRLTHVLENNSLFNKQEFISKITDVFKKDWTEQLNKNQGEENPTNRPNSSGIYSIIDKNIMIYDKLETTFPTVLTKLNTDCIGYALSVFGGKNIFVGGGVSKNYENLLNFVIKKFELSNKCEYYCSEEDCWKDLPPMKIPRYMHRAVTLNNKIYVCGGEKENSVEIFDIRKTRWSDGPSMIDESAWPGVCVLNNCIYVLKKNLQRLDTRCHKWDNLRFNTLKAYNLKNEIFSAVGYQNKIYGFTRENIVTYDTRGERWLEEIKIYEKPYSYDINFPKTCLSNGQIYVMAGHKNGKYSLHSYNASDLTLRYYSSIYLPETEDCLGIFTM